MNLLLKLPLFNTLVTTTWDQFKDGSMDKVNSCLFHDQKVDHNGNLDINILIGTTFLALPTLMKSKNNLCSLRHES
jgi:hypothetical protein